MFAESFFLRARPVCPTYCILQFSTFHVRTYIKSSEFQSRSELLIIENCLPLTYKVTVDLVLKCLQHLHLLALHLEILGYIPHLLDGLVYFRRIGDFKGKIIMKNITVGNTVHIYRSC